MKYIVQKKATTPENNRVNTNAGGGASTNRGSERVGPEQSYPFSGSLGAVGSGFGWPPSGSFKETPYEKTSTPLGQVAASGITITFGYK